MNPRVKAFNKQYDLLAKQEGWMMSNAPEDCYSILKIDDPEAWIDDGWPLDYTEPKFDSDEDAIEFVRQRAAASKMHREAIAIHDARISLPRFRR